MRAAGFINAWVATMMLDDRLCGCIDGWFGGGDGWIACLLGWVRCCIWCAPWRTVDLFFGSTPPWRCSQLDDVLWIPNGVDTANVAEATANVRGLSLDVRV